MHVVFSHGLESGPWGSKITAMAEVARRSGASVESVDYQGMREPQARVEKLSAVLAEHNRRDVVLVGSSMGGHVATAVAQDHKILGLFVLAPAFYMPGYEALTPSLPDCPMAIVHGWHDDVVPVGNTLRFAEAGTVTVHLVDSDHRLASALPDVCGWFGVFLEQLSAERIT